MRQAAFVFVFITVMLDMLALGVMVPVLPKLVLRFEGGDVSQAASITGWFLLAWATMQFLFAPLLGALSDRFGRRPVILLSNLGLGLDYILMALAPSVGWLFLGRVLSGITAASVPTAMAYIADVTPPAQRAARFGMVGAAFGLGFIVGPALGGFLGGYDLRLPFWVSGVLSLINAAYGFFILPESLPPGSRSALDWRKANPLGSLKLLREHPGLLGLAVAGFLYFLAHESLPSVFVLYTDYRYSWDARAVGGVLAIIGVCSTVVSALLVGPAVAKLGERWALITGLLFGAAGFAIYGAAPTGFIFVAGIPIMAIWGLVGPSMQALMSKEVAPSAQGRLQGAISSLRGITGMIGPVLFTQTFAYAVDVDPTRKHWPGAPYLLAATMLVASLVLSWRTTRPTSRRGN